MYRRLGSDYANVALLVTASGTVTGAIGSGFGSEDAIREAAYRYRERNAGRALRSSSGPDEPMNRPPA
jgi:hypothetical protein